MKSRILPYSPEDEFYFTEGCHIIELSNRAEPGMTTRLHRLHGITERYLMLQGEALVDVGELQRQPLRYGDMVTIPPLCPQRITNVGVADLIFLAVCTPRFTRDCYEDIDLKPDADPDAAA